MYTLYVIKSAKGIRYVGYTADLAHRLMQHNSGISKYTKRDSDWRLIYKEMFETRSEAMKREMWFKTGEGRRFLDSIETDSQASS